MKKPILLLITAMILTSLMGAMTFANAQETDPALVAENLLNALDSSRNEVNGLFEAYAENGTIPEGVSEALSEAEALYAETQAAYESGDYELAIDLATKAMNEYGKASAKLMEAEVEAEDENEDTFDKLGGYEKALDRLDKLREIALNLEAQGVDISEAVGLLDEAEVVLGDLGAAFDLGELDDFESMLEEANSLMGHATGLLQSSSNMKRVEKTQHFINQTRERVAQLEIKLNRIMTKYNLSPEDAEAIQLQFQALRDSLDDLIDTEKDDLKDITRQLQHIVKESNKVGKENHDIDDGLIDKINDVNEKETKLYRYRERLGALVQSGYNTSEIEELLNQAEVLLNSTLDSIDEGDEDTSDDQMDEADDLLDQVDDLLDQLEKTRKHGFKDESDDETDDKDGNNFEAKVQELRRKISRHRNEVQNMNRRGENTTELESQLDEIEQSLDEAQNSDDLEVIEDQLDDFENQLDDEGESGNEVEDETDDDSDDDKDKSGNGKDEEPEEPEEPEEEPESTG
ncbi:hypothetical protein MUP51_04070 [Candidatus Bathyarchaeota archaeon]|nr:hypothetical protein [Candidatus Bathyarchaeota archaeon]TFH16442.1 MAG: hypothetical protein E4H04_06600 [Candidatus Bathyarchaeota archaeon]